MRQRSNAGRARKRAAQRSSTCLPPRRSSRAAHSSRARHRGPYTTVAGFERLGAPGVCRVVLPTTGLRQSVSLCCVRRGCHVACVDSDARSCSPSGLHGSRCAGGGGGATMFGLYGDLPAAKDAGDAPAEASKPSWATGLAAQLKPAPRKPAVHGPPPAALRAAHARVAPAPQPRPAAASAATPAAATPGPAPAPAAAAGPSLSAAVTDEYDPARPNSYDEAARQRALKRKQEELEEKRRVLERQRQVRTAARCLCQRSAADSGARRSWRRGASRLRRLPRSSTRTCRCLHRRRCRRRRPWSSSRFRHRLLCPCRSGRRRRRLPRAG